MLWKCWNTLIPDNIHEIEADSLDAACTKAREIDPNVNMFQVSADYFQPNGSDNNGENKKFYQ